MYCQNMNDILINENNVIKILEMNKNFYALIPIIHFV